MVIELVLYMPSRRYAKDRMETMPVIGVTNYNVADKVYYAIFEVDKKNDEILNQLLRLKPAMVVETLKGYHCYLNYKHPNPLKILHYCYRIKWADKGQLSLAKKRYLSGHQWGARLILRVSPKYVDVNDLNVIYEGEMEEWHLKIRKLIEKMNR